MDSAQADTVATSPRSAEKQTSPVVRFMSWFLPCSIFCVVIARGAVLVQARWAPLVVFSLLLGMLLGGVIAAMIALAGGQRAAIVLPATAALALLLIVSEHFFFFRDGRLADYEKALAKNPTARLVEIPFPDLSMRSFLQFVRSNANPGRAALHAVLVLAAAVVTVAMAARSRSSSGSSELQVTNP